MTLTVTELLLLYLVRRFRCLQKLLHIIFSLAKPVLICEQFNDTLQLIMFTRPICRFSLPEIWNPPKKALAPDMMKGGFKPKAEIKKQPTKTFWSTFAGPTSESWAMTARQSKFNLRGCKSQAMCVFLTC